MPSASRPRRRLKPKPNETQATQRIEAARNANLIAPPPPGDVAIGQGRLRKVQEATFETFPQRARRLPSGVRMQTVWPWLATTPRARHTQSAWAGDAPGVARHAIIIVAKIGFTR